MWSAGTNWVVFPSAMGPARFPNGSSTPHHPPSHVTDPATLDWLAQIDMFYALETSAFLQGLASTPDLDGNNLLDNTVVAYVTEVGRAFDHDQRNVPFLVFGGSNTHIRGGQYLRATGGPLPSIDAASGNRPTNDAWLSLAPVFGVSMTKLGAPTQSTGPLPGLLTA